ncbi:MAG: flagellar hook-associated protein FlgK [Pseudomonadota bacterium]
MSLSLTLNHALTGLRAATRQTDLIANNVANALTEGYGRREIELSAAAIAGAGAGVKVEGVSRAASPFISDARRLADASAGGADVLADARGRLAAAVGQPGDSASLASSADRLDAALAAAAETPESTALLSTAVTAARDYANTINRIGTEAMTLRTEADASIGAQVDRMNDGLNQIKSLNEEIRARSLTGADITALEDQRERVIRQITDIVPVRVVQRPNDEVAIYAKNGGQLLDGRVYELEFTPTRVVAPNQTLAGGALSGISVRGVDIPIGEGGDRGLFDGGSLSAAFELRDRIIPEFTADLDGAAEDAILRVQGLAADPTVGPTDAGIFTDEGLAYDPLDVVGLSLRISINPSIDPDAGGEVTRLRDGVAAAAPGDTGNGALLRALQDALQAPAAAPAGTSFTGDRSFSGFAVELSSGALAASSTADGRAGFTAGQLAALNDAELGDIGVDTDQELSRLLLVEQAYAANARVIQVVDELFARLLEI